MSQKNRRKILNIIINPHSQFIFAVPLIFLFLCMAILIQVTNQQIATALVNLKVTDTNESTFLTAFQSIITQATFTGIGGMLAIGFLFFVFWIYYSHRIFGPIVSIRRQIKNISEGKYDSQIHLRRWDEFKPVADDLNQLARILDKKAKN